MIIMGCMIVFSIPASWVFEKIGWYKTVSIAGIVLMVFTLLRGFIGGSPLPAPGAAREFDLRGIAFPPIA